MGGLIYKAVFNRYDKLRPLKHKLDGVQYLMITDQPEGEIPPGWLYSRMSPVITDRWMNRFLKMNLEALLPHPSHYDWIMYLDGSLEPTDKLTRQVIEGWLDGAGAALFRHPVRKTSAEEADFLRVPRPMSSAPGLWAGGMFLRVPGNPLGKLWWQEMETMRADRDQLVLPAVVFDIGKSACLHTIDADIWKNPWFTFTSHGR